MWTDIIRQYHMAREANQMGSENMTVLPLATFFLGFALALLLYPRIIGFHYDEPTNRHAESIHKNCHQ
jgi:hypothetical protein